MSQHAAIFPGQGAQVVGMGQDVAAAHAVAAETYAQADEVLGFSLSRLCFEGPPEKLGGTDIQQPAIFATCIALYRAGIDARRFRDADFSAMGGLSLGEYTALHMAGSISFADTLRLVYRRGQLMQAASEAIPSGMVSLIGGDESQVLALCEKVAAHGRLWPANYNCPGQVVASGEKAACEAAVQLAGDCGLRAVPLPVAGAFHSEIMRPAADGLRAMLAECEIKSPRVRVVANSNAEYHTTPDAIRASLYEQLVSPTRWHACVLRLIADGVQQFWEIGPSRHLTGMMRKIDRSAKTVNVGSAADLAAAP